jgi:hypothetical protein
LNFDKSGIFFILETSDGDVFTVYENLYGDYDFGADDKSLIEFHIGGHSQSVTEKAKTELVDMLNLRGYPVGKLWRIDLSKNKTLNKNI